jgi:hypothetical protein
MPLTSCCNPHELVDSSQSEVSRKQRFLPCKIQACHIEQSSDVVLNPLFDVQVIRAWHVPGLSDRIVYLACLAGSSCAYAVIGSPQRTTIRSIKHLQHNRLERKAVITVSSVRRSVHAQLTGKCQDGVVTRQRCEDSISSYVYIGIYMEELVVYGLSWKTWHLDIAAWQQLWLDRIPSVYSERDQCMFDKFRVFTDVLLYIRWSIYLHGCGCCCCPRWNISRIADIIVRWSASRRR